MILIIEARSRPLLGVARGLASAGHEVSIASDVAIDSMKAVRAAVAAAKPSAVVLTGGCDDALACEEDPERAFVLNAEGTIHLAAAALEFRATPILISTAAVFGDDGREHGEEEEPAPASVYGRSRRQGETFFLRAAKQGLVLRVGHVLEDGLARERTRIADRIEASEREPISVIGAVDLGTAIAAAVNAKLGGVVHAANATVTELELWRGIQEACGGRPIEASFRRGGAALLCGRLRLEMRPWSAALADAAHQEVRIVEDVRRLAVGEAIVSEGPAQIEVRAGKVVVESAEDAIVKAGQTIQVEGRYRVVAIDETELVFY